jgi:cytoskeletal protein RodZ
MPEETEKQEGQKTVVAFIAGLLIGGLLVWVFSSSPDREAPVADTATDTDTPTGRTVDTSDNTTRTNENVTRQTTQTTASEPTAQEPETVGEGEIVVSDQEAGSVVTLTRVTFPTNAGWVVVRDYDDKVPGSILGAARYNQSDALLPQSVSLLRNTEVGSTYQIIFYSENGDRVFDLTDDSVIEGFQAFFTAE